MTTHQDYEAARIAEAEAGRRDMLCSLRSAQSCTPVAASAMPAPGRKDGLPVRRRHRLMEQATTSGAEVGANAHDPRRWQRRTHPRLRGLQGLGGVVEILEGRQSEICASRASGVALLDLLHLLSLSRRSGKDAAGREWQSRYYPAAGGTHCIEPLLYVHDAEDHPTGWFCQIGPRSTDVRAIHPPEADQLVALSISALRLNSAPSAIIFAVADPEILLARYPHGSTLMWRDAGAFLAMAHLCGSLLGMSSSIAGIACELSGQPSAIPLHVVGAIGLGGSDHVH